MYLLQRKGRNVALVSVSLTTFSFPEVELGLVPSTVPLEPHIPSFLL
jgi:hypothetical protein